MVSDLEQKSSGLRQYDFPTLWVMQPVLVDLPDVLMQYQEELSERQDDESVKTLLNIKGVMSWLCDETE